jgi:hypothetical protein
MLSIPALALLLAADPVIDTAIAARCFQQARLASEEDGGRLWGRSVYGPVLLVDPETLTVVANQPDKEGKLTPAGDVFTGRLPPGTMVANTAFPWSGVTWAMVRWPLPGSAVERVQLIIHESWHRIQADLGLPGAEGSNAHLDSYDGRLLLRLELRALQAALRAEGAVRDTAVADALLFRAARRARAPQSNEARLEVHEGLAEYTGVKLRGTPEAETRRALADRLGEPPPENFTRSFAYITGPAYGLLLDATGRPWRAGLTPTSDLAGLLRASTGVTVPADPRREAEARSGAYGGPALVAEEQARERERVRRYEAYRERLVTGPVLELPLAKFNMVMNPAEVMPLGEFGTVYPTLTLKAEWGTLTATNGARIAADFRRAFVRAPASVQARPVAGDGWKLELSDGWRIARGAREGDLKAVPVPKP